MVVEGYHRLYKRFGSLQTFVEDSIYTEQDRPDQRWLCSTYEVHWKVSPLVRGPVWPV
jgi:hypothetical protein